MANVQTKDIDDLKKTAMNIARCMGCHPGQIIIDVNPSYNMVIVKFSEIRKRIKEDGDEVTISETRLIK